MSTPGTVSSRRIAGEARLCSASARSTSAISEFRKVIWRRQPSTVIRSSSGRSCSPSHSRPALPNRSLAGGPSLSVRAITAWISFFARVRCRTSCARRAIQRRSARVGSSGTHTSSRNPAASSRASVRASSLSVLALAWLICLSFLVLATTTRAACGLRIRTITTALLPASNAISSSGARLCANSSSSARDVLIRPAERICPSSAIATSQASWPTSNPDEAHDTLPSRR